LIKNIEKSKEISAGKRFVYAFITMLIAVLLALLCAELLFRATGRFVPTAYKKSAIPGLGFEMKNGFVFDNGENTIRFNSEGFRDAEFTVKKMKNSLRVVCLGDSMTAGVALPLDALYLNVLEQMFDATEQKVEFQNMAVGGYNTAQQWLVYEHKAKKYNPDLIMVQFLMNDLTYSYPVYQGESSIGKLKAFLGDHLRLYNFLSFLKRGIKANQTTELINIDPQTAPISLEFFNAIFDPTAPYFNQWTSQIKKFGELNRSGTPTLFVIFPWPIYEGMDEGKAYPYYSIHNQVKDALRKEGLNYVDVTPELMSRGNIRQFWVSSDDFHLNAEAHRIIAEVLFRELRSSLAD